MAFPKPCMLSTFPGFLKGHPGRTNPCKEQASVVIVLLDYMKRLGSGDWALMSKLLEVLGDPIAQLYLVVLGVELDSH